MRGLLTLVALIAAPAFGAGTPVVHNYDRSEYGGGGQVIAAAQDSRGILYFTNNAGLLEYDGASWRTHDLPGSLDAVATDADDVVWLGGPGEIGRMAADADGVKTYASEVDRLPEGDREFSDVWPVLATDRGVFFMARERLIRWHRDHLTTWPADADAIFYRAYEIHGELLFAQVSTGLLRLRGDVLEPIPGGEIFADKEVNAMFELEDGSALVFTRLWGAYRVQAEGVEPVESQAEGWLIDAQVQHGCELPDGRYALGTRRGGVAILGQDLAIDTVLDTESGLASDGINFVMVDQQDNLWLATDDGISRVMLDASLTLFAAEAGLEGSVYSLTWHRDQLHVGTGMGLFQEIPDPYGGPPRFAAVPDLPSAVWSTLGDNDNLLSATTDGVFVVRTRGRNGLSVSTVERLSTEAALLLFRLEAFPDHVFVSLANGIGAVRSDGDTWTWLGRLDGAPGVEIRRVAEGAGGEILATAFGRPEIYRIQFPANLENGLTTQVLAPPSSGMVTAVGGDLIFSGAEGPQRYLGIDDEGPWPFAPAPDLEPLSPDGSPFWILDAGPDRLWLYQGQLKLADRDPEGGWRPRELAARRLEGPVVVAEDPDGAGTWIGAEEGLYRFDPSAQTRASGDFRALVRRVAVLGTDRVLHGGGPRAADAPPKVLPYADNRLRFEFAAPNFDQQAGSLFQLRLEDFDPDWSGWSAASSKEYTNLPEGSYTFRVRAQNAWGDVSRAATFSFVIEPPWYRTWWAYGVYMASALAFLFLFARLRSAGLRRDKERLERQVAQRTQELEERNRFAEGQARELAATNRELAAENELRRRLEEEQIKMQARMEQAQKLESLGLMAGGIAHDFNNLLMAVLGNAELSLEDEALDPEPRRRLMEISRAAQRAADLCQQMLAFAGKGPRHESRIDLGKLAADVSGLVRGSAGSKIDLRVELSPDLPPCRGDADQLRQVLMGLLLNAVEAVGDRGGTVRVVSCTRRLGHGELDDLVPETPPPGLYASVRVEDDGAGMDDETRRRIFDPFFSTKFAGRGLGLAAALGIAHGHGGAIRVASEPGRGSTFEMLLPALSPEDLADDESKEPEAAPPRPRSGAVLVVDDEPMVRTVASLMLRNYGLDVLESSSGQRALELFERRADDIAVVLIDLTMPGLDGVETFRRMRRIDPEVPAVLSSGFGEDTIEERYLEEGFSAFLHKPYRSEALFACLRKALG